MVEKYYSWYDMIEKYYSWYNVVHVQEKYNYSKVIILGTVRVQRCTVQRREVIIFETFVRKYFYEGTVHVHVVLLYVYCTCTSGVRVPFAT